MTELGYAVLYWCVSAGALMIVAYVLPGFKVGSFPSALLTAVIIGLANVFIRPVLLFLTLPLNILTLGLFTFVVNAMVLKICSWVLPNFEIRSWFSAILGAVLLALVGGFLHAVLF